MQLFSVGLYDLKDDGTRAGTGETYTNDDIVTLARAWTGFKTRANRPNIEMFSSKGTFNYVDPMEIDEDNRDVFPKATLGGEGYLGDRFPLCRDVPEKAFLRKGQGEYVFQGSSKAYDDDDQSEWWDSEQFAPASTGALYAALCQPDADGACAWPPRVVLTQDAACDGGECDVDSVRVVAVTGTSGTAHYAYEPAPCADLAFFPNATLVQGAWSLDKNVLCADPFTSNAVVACCDESGAMSRECVFQGERTCAARIVRGENGVAATAAT